MLHHTPGRRPVLGSSWVAGQLSLAVDAFNFLNTEWEPIVEPWQCGFGFAAVDLGEYGSEAAVYTRGRAGSGSSSSLHGAGAGAGGGASGSYVCVHFSWTRRVRARMKQGVVPLLTPTTCPFH